MHDAAAINLFFQDLATGIAVIGLGGLAVIVGLMMIVWKTP